MVDKTKTKKKITKKKLQKKTKNLKKTVKKLKTKRADIIINNNIRNGTGNEPKNDKLSIPSTTLQSGTRDDFQNKQNILQIENELKKGRAFVNSALVEQKGVSDNLLKAQNELLNVTEKEKTLKNSTKQISESAKQAKKDIVNAQRRTRNALKTQAKKQAKAEEAIIQAAILKKENEDKKALIEILKKQYKYKLSDIKSKSILELEKLIEENVNKTNSSVKARVQKIEQNTPQKTQSPYMVPRVELEQRKEEKDIEHKSNEPPKKTTEKEKLKATLIDIYGLRNDELANKTSKQLKELIQVNINRINNFESIPLYEDIYEENKKIPMANKKNALSNSEIVDDSLSNVNEIVRKPQFRTNIMSLFPNSPSSLNLFNTRQTPGLSSVVPGSSELL